MVALEKPRFAVGPLTLLARRVGGSRLAARVGGLSRAARGALWLALLRLLYQLHYRHVRRIPRPLEGAGRGPTLLAFTGSGLLIAYYHGVVTYIRDHFHLDSTRLSAISGGCSAVLGLGMGLDLYEVLLLGLRLKQKILRERLYLHKVEDVAAMMREEFEGIGITNEDVERLSRRKQAFFGVTQCFPPGHRCVNVPDTVDDLIALMLCSCCVLPFFATPGVFKGRYYVDGCFSAFWSVPEDQPWEDVVRFTSVPSVVSAVSAAGAHVQPSRLLLWEMMVPVVWEDQIALIERGYQDARAQHAMLEARGMRPRADAPLTPWSEWQRLYRSIDEHNLPPASRRRVTAASTEREKAHDELLRTHSETDLTSCLGGASLRRLAEGKRGSQSDQCLFGSEAGGAQKLMAAAVRAR